MLTNTCTSTCTHTILKHVRYFVSGGHHQDAKVRVNIKVKDVNDNAPEFATQDEVVMCENVTPGTVTLFIILFFPNTVACVTE